MTKIQTRLKVSADGNVIVPIGQSEAGEEVDVTVVTPTVAPKFPAAGSRLHLPRQQWLEEFRKTEGSISDPTFRPLVQPMLEPVPDFDDLSN